MLFFPSSNLLLSYFILLLLLLSLLCRVALDGSEREKVNDIKLLMLFQNQLARQLDHLDSIEHEFNMLEKVS